MIKNTSKEEVHPEWLMGGNPSAIEAQEAQGQKQLVQSSQLPIKNNNWRPKLDTKEQYEKMGIKVIGATQGDQMFFDVELPEGWKKQTTDHSMWSELVDNNGSVRANIFYKAAFYDRSSHIDFTTRYMRGSEHIDSRQYYYHVVDGLTGVELFRSDTLEGDNMDAEYFKRQDAYSALCDEFLNKNYPDWQDVNAYWE